MKFRIEINQKEIIEAGIKGLKIQEWLLFDVVRHMIGADWTKKITEGEKSYAWVSEQSILDQIPLLELSKRQVHRLVDNLVEAGLILRFAGNKGAKRVYLGLTPLGDSLGRHSMTNMAISNASECQKRQSENDKSGNLSMTEMSEDNKINNNPIKDTISTRDSASESLPKEKRVPKKKLKLTRIEVQGFYESELTNSLKDPLPPELLAAAARRPEITHELLFKAYKELVDYMTGASDMWPNGMWRCVLTKPDQLSFVQFCKLVLERGMTRAEIKSYLDQWENKLYDNTSLYATIVGWRNREAANPQKPFNGTGQQQSKGLPVPKRIEQ